MERTLPKYREIKSIFFRQGINRAVLSWLSFEYSMQQDNWASRARSCIDSSGSSLNGSQERGSGGLNSQELSSQESSSDRSKGIKRDTDLIDSWLNTPSHSNINGVILAVWLPPTLGVVMGFLAMLGATSYSGAKPINLWLMIALFGVLPFFSALISLLFIFTLRRTRSNSAFLNKYTYLVFLRNNTLFSSGSLINHSLIRPWFMWSFQSLALAFQLSAFVSFIVILLFQDLAFAWSSTIIEKNAVVVSFFQGLAWPWHFFIPPPSQTFIESSQFYRGSETLNAVLLGQWWSYIVMIMLVYGVIPRFLVWFVMRQYVKRLLGVQIELSGRIDTFLSSVRTPLLTEPNVATDPSAVSNTETARDPQINHPQINHPDKVATANHVESCELDDGFDGQIIAWQWADHLNGRRLSSRVLSKGIPVLGRSSWLDDEEWVRKNAALWHSRVGILVRVHQTPTAELSDILGLMKRMNPQLTIYLLLILDKQVESENDVSLAAKYLNNGQVRSWTLFSEQQNITVCLIDSRSQFLCDVVMESADV